MFEMFKGKFCLVGFSSYGLKAGVIDEVSDDGKTVRFSECHSIFRFEAQPASAGCQGVDALAVVGPAKGSRIGPKVGKTVVLDVKRITVCTDAAQAAFQSAGWAK